MPKENIFFRVCVQYKAISSAAAYGRLGGKMTEAEVILRIALYYLKNHLTDEDVYVSIDGAHIKIGSTYHFDIQLFLKQNGCIYVSEDLERWQGEYKVMGSEHNLIISSTPGVGDVKVHLEEGKELLIEAKKGKTNKSGQEYVLMREAIGQLMTSDKWTKSTIPVVAVPYSEKSYELAERWSKVAQIRRIGIGFMLVREDGVIEWVGYNR